MVSVLTMGAVTASIHGQCSITCPPGDIPHHRFRARLAALLSRPILNLPNALQRVSQCCGDNILVIVGDVTCIT